MYSILSKGYRKLSKNEYGLVWNILKSVSGGNKNEMLKRMYGCTCSKNGKSSKKRYQEGVELLEYADAVLPKNFYNICDAYLSKKQSKLKVLETFGITDEELEKVLVYVYIGFEEGKRVGLFNDCMRKLTEEYLKPCYYRVPKVLFGNSEVDFFKERLQYVLALDFLDGRSVLYDYYIFGKSLDMISNKGKNEEAIVDIVNTCHDRGIPLNSRFVVGESKVNYPRIAEKAKENWVNHQLCFYVD